MLYLLDANVLITAHRTYYPLARVPEFWEWLVHQGEQGAIKIVQEIYEEFKGGKDELATWAKRGEVEDALRLGETVDISLVRRVLNAAYAPDLTDDELEELGRDPFLVAYALADRRRRTIVTTEVSKPRRQRANRHLPDVCKDLEVSCCNTFQMTTALDFRTGWRA